MVWRGVEGQQFISRCVKWLEVSTGCFGGTKSTHGTERGRGRNHRSPAKGGEPVSEECVRDFEAVESVNHNVMISISSGNYVTDYLLFLMQWDGFFVSVGFFPLFFSRTTWLHFLLVETGWWWQVACPQENGADLLGKLGAMWGQPCLRSWYFHHANGRGIWSLGTTVALFLDLSSEQRWAADPEGLWLKQSSVVTIQVSFLQSPGFLVAKLGSPTFSKTGDATW